MITRNPLYVLSVIFTLALSTATAVAEPPAGGVAIIDARVLPMNGHAVLNDQTVLIVDDRIVGIGPSSNLKPPTGYKVINGRGLTLMPGLVDMHVHLADAPGDPGDPAQRALAVMLAHGVTTARGMAGSANNLTARARVQSGQIAGPRLYAASPAINTANTKTAEGARASVAAAKDAGFDLIKSHQIENLDVWAAVQDEAARRGMPVAGHVTNAVGLTRALAAHEEVEHLDGSLLELLSADAPERSADFGQIPPPPIINTLAQATDASINALASKVAHSGVYQVPTLSLFETATDPTVPTAKLVAAKDMRYVPDQVLTQWTAQREQMSAGMSAESAARFKTLRQRIVRAYYKAGVPLMAGSDTAQAFTIWGSGLIHEVQALGAAGLPPLEALKTATVNPRNYFRSLPNGGSGLGWKADFGVVEVGARADIILLRQDPSQDLAALNTLDTVVAAGHVYDRRTLDAMLDHAALDAKTSPPAARSPAPSAKQVYVMRHLPAGSGADPSLSTDGARTATVLSEFLDQAAIKAIYITDTKRARQTASPLARKLGLTPVVYQPNEAAGLVAQIKAAPGNVLVVGHSNTLPKLIADLGGRPIQPPGDGEFRAVWRIDGSGDTRLFNLDEARPAALGPCNVPGLSPEARCGVVAVAENRQMPNGRIIHIRFAVVPARGQVKDSPLVVLPGGPGLGGVASGAGIERLFGPMLNDRDLLLIDQRGTGASNPLACPQPDHGDSALSRLGGTPPEEVKACRALLEKTADLGLYNTRQAVLDMDVVRQALGYQKLDMFGMSYGTRLALDYIRLFAAHVGETVIRSAAPVQMHLPVWTPRDAQVSYQRFVQACEAQPDCAAEHPRLMEQLQSIVNRLDQGPIPITIIDPRDGKTLKTSMDRSGFGSVLFFSLYIPEFYARLPPLIEQAASGNLSPMVQAVAPALIGTVDQVAWGMRWSVVCNEDLVETDPSSIDEAAKNTFMGAETVRSELQACALWPHRAVPRDYFKPLATNKPVFVISGEMDPVAGRVWGAEVVRTLPNSLHVEVPGASHLPPLPGCTGSLMAEFISGSPLTSLDTSCVAKTPRPKISVVGNGSAR
ncbi:MAG: alpha/beta fold hydrolase [Luteimonas sp.]